ncbi:MAG TPA: hypothetical protein VNO30_01515 [Kofleriaceae bacterium]|nr:hypothetical protein [Kofleriaceae bacterium]
MARRLAISAPISAPIWASLAAALATAAGAGAGAACSGSGASAAGTRPAPPPQLYTLVGLVGGWRWLHRTSEAGTTRIEDEVWRLLPMPGAPTRLAGRYVRTVEVRSDDRVPFRCNQRPWYRQRAVFDVEVDITRTGFAIREIAHRAEPTPCDTGSRQLGSYAAERAGERLVLRWDGGEQTLWQIDDERAPLPGDPWPAAPPITGRWRWDASSYDDAGNVHDEREQWQITRRSETRLDATYRRRVTVRSPDGAAKLACAGAPSWTFDDAYVVELSRDRDASGSSGGSSSSGGSGSGGSSGGGWHLFEIAAQPGAHPCLRATPRRHLDEATVEQIGDHLVLVWRGKRRQVLYRDDAGA